MPPPQYNAFGIGVVFFDIDPDFTAKEADAFTEFLSRCGRFLDLTWQVGTLPLEDWDPDWPDPAHTYENGGIMLIVNLVVLGKDELVDNVEIQMREATLFGHVAVNAAYKEFLRSWKGDPRDERGEGTS